MPMLKNVIHNDYHTIAPTFAVHVRSNAKGRRTDFYHNTFEFHKFHNFDLNEVEKL